MAIILKANNLFNKEDLHDLYEMYMEQLNNGLIILQGGIQFVHESTDAHEIEILQEEETPAADLQRELHITRMRLQHLLQSEFISTKANRKTERMVQVAVAIPAAVKCINIRDIPPRWL